MPIYDGSDGLGTVIDNSDYPYPTVVTYKDLRGLDKDGRLCESCNSDMHSHNWVLMDKNGFVLFCEFMVRKDN